MKRTAPSRYAARYAALCFHAAAMCGVVACPASATDARNSAPPISIETLLKGGWRIAGYTGTFDNRSTLILFHHPDKNFLVQCSTIYDVTRSPRTVVNCYELH